MKMQEYVFANGATAIVYDFEKDGTNIPESIYMEMETWGYDRCCVLKIANKKWIFFDENIDPVLEVLETLSEMSFTNNVKVFRPNEAENHD